VRDAVLLNAAAALVAAEGAAGGTGPAAGGAGAEDLHEAVHRQLAVAAASVDSGAAAAVLERWTAAPAS
jgi:anthranilate phosphoribosyltransferase